MKQMVPKAKMGKKARKRLDAEKRAFWTVNPVTKRIESKKQYSRAKASRELRKEWSSRDASFGEPCRKGFAGRLFPGPSLPAVLQSISDE